MTPSNYSNQKFFQQQKEMDVVIGQDDMAFDDNQAQAFVSKTAANQGFNDIEVPFTPTKHQFSAYAESQPSARKRSKGGQKSTNQGTSLRVRKNSQKSMMASF